jgi:phosphoadenosine phosphosulfate reductase
VNKIDLSKISSDLENATPQEILRWAVDAYGRGLTMATAFGVEGCALIAMLAEIDPAIRVINLETGYQFPETLQVRERIREKYGIEVEHIFPDETVGEMEARFGGPIYNRMPDECCRIRKIVPLKRALEGYSAWVSAIRREQTPDRSRTQIVQWDPKFDLVKISPLANWTKKDVWSYALDNDVPYNPLHDRGFPSIGCWPCTHAVGQDAEDRDGRWAGLPKIECGIHSH